jgi:hypothetical protein
VAPVIAWAVFALGWAVFALALVVTICTNIALRQHYKHSYQPELPANTIALTQLTSVVAVAAGYSPFHLLWFFPLSYFIGFFTLRSRVFCRLAWLYGYVVAYTIPSKWVSSTALDRAPLAKLRRVLKGAARVRDVTDN